MNSNDRTIVGLVMLAHAMVHTYELSFPIFLTVWLTEFNATTGTLGIVVGVGYALFGLGALPGGVLSDSYGSRSLIVLCLFGMAGSFLLLSVAPTLPVVALALFLWGISASVYHPAGLALLSKGVSERGSAFAYHGMAGNFGIAFGPLATTLLLLVFDWRTVVGILAVPALIAAFLAFRTNIDESAAVEGQETRADGGVSSLTEFFGTSRTLFAGWFVAVFGVVMMSGLYYRGVLTFLPDLLGELPMFAPVDFAGESLEPARYLYAGLLTVGMAGQYVGGKLTDRVENARAIAVSFGLLAVIAIVFVPASNAGLAPLLAVSFVLGFCLFVVQPLYQATVAEYTPPEARGISYGYTYLGVFGVGALGATIAGVVLQYFSPTVLFTVLAGFAVVASLLGAVLAVRGPSAS
ncbi:MFS transporter [Haladaptatus pallidirubidus]|uniref:MFS transporter n=1 Tax=Haladaptatus pallidirubidus TaxID=1008152 RepID=A0AAV3UN36_9EURY|nr:MFS transporter [Haladaptatus pallidirubidus]